ncbi:hypothetical protein BC834DRAFT_904281 [Gloeopeniophorella convolvens]|nr:hypothetical protein BC834DRAFT_904281 [Gloeopeniophorella convolvens]
MDNSGDSATAASNFSSNERGIATEDAAQSARRNNGTNDCTARLRIGTTSRRSTTAVGALAQASFYLSHPIVDGRTRTPRRRDAATA